MKSNQQDARHMFWRTTRYAPLRLLLALLAFAGCKGDGTIDVEQVTVSIGPEGGTFEAADGAVTLVVPPGALDASITITATPTSVSGSLPVIAGTAWELGPDGTHFAEPVELTIRYDPAAVTANPADFRIVNVLEAEGELELLGYLGHDEAAGTVTGTIRGFSTKGVASCGSCFPVSLVAEYEGVTEGVELSWDTPTWSWLRIYRAAFRQCEPGESSGEFGPYECVSTPAEALTPPPECIAPGTAPDGRSCMYKLHRQAPGVWEEIQDRQLGSRGAIFWYQARGGSDEDPMRAWSYPPQQVSYFGTLDPPEVPNDFTATSVAATKIRLDWQPTPTASDYELERLGTDGWTLTLPYSDFTLTDSLLTEGTRYDYRIRSVNENGVSAYASANATPSGGAGAGSISGVLTANGYPIDDAAVLLGGAATAHTNPASDGSYAFTGLAAGDYTVTVAGFPSYIVFPDSTVEVTLGAGEAATVDFTGGAFVPDCVNAVPPTAGTIVLVDLAGDPISSPITTGTTFRAVAQGFVDNVGGGLDYAWDPFYDGTTPNLSEFGFFIQITAELPATYGIYVRATDDCQGHPDSPVGYNGTATAFITYQTTS